MPTESLHLASEHWTGIQEPWVLVQPLTLIVPGMVTQKGLGLESCCVVLNPSKSFGPRPWFPHLYKWGS